MRTKYVRRLFLVLWSPSSSSPIVVMLEASARRVNRRPRRLPSVFRSVSVPHDGDDDDDNDGVGGGLVVGLGG